MAKRKKKIKIIFTEEANEQICETDEGNFRKMTGRDGRTNYDTPVRKELEQTMEFF